jgi:hypothetical protein
MTLGFPSGILFLLVRHQGKYLKYMREYCGGIIYCCVYMSRWMSTGMLPHFVSIELHMSWLMMEVTLLHYSADLPSYI